MINDKDKLIESQARLVLYLQGRVDKLEKEKAELERALYRQTVRADRTYRDQELSFDRMAKLVLKTVIDLVKSFKKPVTHDQIIRAFQNQYGFGKAETISRRVRYLADERYCREHFGVNHALLHSPSRGKFVPVEAVKH